MRRLAVAALHVLIFAAPPASAQSRRRFEPTDLQLQPEGTLEVDTQAGFAAGQSADRLVLPDLEVSLGLTRGVQLEIDATYAVEGRPGARFTFDHPAPDNLWVSTKIAQSSVSMACVCTRESPMRA